MKHEPWCASLRPSVFVGDNPCDCGAKGIMALRMVFAVLVAVGLFLLVYGAHAESSGCRPIVDVVKIAQDLGGTVRPMTQRELDFARGMYVAQPNTPADYPKGEGGLIMTRNGAVMIAFTSGSEACDLIAIGADGVRNLDRIAHGPGAPS